MKMFNSPMRLALCAVLYALCSLPVRGDIPEDHTLELTSQSAIGLRVFQANQKTYTWSVKENNVAVNLTGYTPVMYWATSNRAGSIVTAHCAIVTATAGTFNAVFSPASLNTNGTMMYGIGMSSGNVTIARQGTFVITPDPYSTGAGAVVFANTNVNLSLFNFTGAMTGPSSITASYFIGDGSGLTAVTATNIIGTGTVVYASLSAAVSNDVMIGKTNGITEARWTAGTNDSAQAAILDAGGKYVPLGDTNSIKQDATNAIKSGINFAGQPTYLGNDLLTNAATVGDVDALKGRTQTWENAAANASAATGDLVIVKGRTGTWETAVYDVSILQGRTQTWENAVLAGTNHAQLVVSSGPHGMGSMAGSNNTDYLHRSWTNGVGSVINFPIVDLTGITAIMQAAGGAGISLGTAIINITGTLQSNGTNIMPFIDQSSTNLALSTCPDLTTNGAANGNAVVFTNGNFMLAPVAASAGGGNVFVESNNVFQSVTPIDLTNANAAVRWIGAGYTNTVYATATNFTFTIFNGGGALTNYYLP